MSGMSKPKLGVTILEKRVILQDQLSELLEEAGAAGIVASYWSRGFGVNKIFSARTKKIPTVDLELEDYTMLYRLAESWSYP